MTKKPFGRFQRGAALVPLALLSTAWTASLLGVGVAGTTAASASDQGVLPDGTSVPTQVIEDPASFSTPGSIGLGVPQGSTERIVAAASTNGVPDAALAAYQRAATVINAADASCKLPWQLLAAIGRVESDHGRYGNNTLGKDGVSRPGIYGIPLDGTNGTQRITDTDGGQYDRDTEFDRAVGPMQFIPSTWSVVGVDADGDGQRNPQDIDDAALAAAVYLCSGKDDLSTDSGQRAAVYRYNHSEKYVDLVLSIMKAYQSGNYSTVPNNTTSALYIPPSYNFTRPSNGAILGAPEKVTPPSTSTGDSSTEGNGGNAGTGGQSGNTGGNGNSDSGKSTTGPLEPVKEALKPVTEPLKPITEPVEEALEPIVEEVIKPVDNLISSALARTLCLPFSLSPKHADCVAMLTGAKNDSGVITGILRALGLAR
ncbi:lytic transglycosylase domain-containing protein [Nocardioides sp. AE5]|uniref:lytic transglycosylase domain-containing protein n=1 Tax=Nocardioides sp. AE5 TaxID=2962573 RepID=UPI00288114A2|nr:lytic transglycosylase domain-containing protein [Nocardioides sp. AE5]MDT0200645.1 lytic transglycosylase domain-containing protein [Nocardioides sp. AE5]